MRQIIALILPCLIAVGCLNPLAMRRAETLKPGEIEVLIAPELAGASAVLTPVAPATGGIPIGLPSVTGSLRFGVIENLDLQLKVDPGIIPEVSMGYQLVGQRKDDIKVSLVGGIRPALFVAPPNGGAGIISLPVGVLVDIPVGESAFYAGMRLSPTVVFGSVAGFSATTLLVDPVINLGFSLNIGSFILQPELGIKQGVSVFNSVTGADFALGFTQYSLALGLGGRFGGAPQVSPAPKAGPAPTPAPAEVKDEQAPSEFEY